MKYIPLPQTCAQISEALNSSFESSGFSVSHDEYTMTAIAEWHGEVSESEVMAVCEAFIGCRMQEVDDPRYSRPYVMRPVFSELDGEKVKYCCDAVLLKRLGS